MVAQAETVLACVHEVLGSNVVQDSTPWQLSPLISEDKGPLMNQLTCTHQHITASKTEIHKIKRHGKTDG
jgi:hypothetical protein